MNRLKFTGLSASVALAAVAALALAIGLMGHGTAQACTGDNCEEVDTSGDVGGTGTELKIECKWELPDMSPNDMAMTYANPWDDTPAVDADAPPCDPVNQPVAADLRHHMMGILPNAEDLPNARQYEKWVAIESTNIGDIIDVYWKVWEPYVAGPPNGPNCANPVAFGGDTGTEAALYCFKYQHHATATLGPPTGANPLLMIADSKGNCSQLQNPPLTQMFTAAVETGQMTPAAVTDIINRCFQREKAIFRVQEEISKDQPSGEYRVEVTAVNVGGQTFQNVNFFDVIGFIKLQLDFTAVPWGPLTNNSASWLSGDMNFVPGDGKPTVKNVGNDPMYVEVHYDPLVLDSDPTKTIERFDLKFRADWQTDPATTTTVDPIYASSWYCFDQHPVGSNDVGKLDLSVHPENAQAGSYNGKVNVIGLPTCDQLGIHTH